MTQEQAISLYLQLTGDIRSLWFAFGGLAVVVAGWLLARKRPIGASQRLALTIGWLSASGYLGSAIMSRYRLAAALVAEVKSANPQSAVTKAIAASSDLYIPLARSPSQPCCSFGPTWLSRLNAPVRDYDSEPSTLTDVDSAFVQASAFAACGRLRLGYERHSYTRTSAGTNVLDNVGARHVLKLLHLDGSIYRRTGKVAGRKGKFRVVRLDGKEFATRAT